MPRNMKILGICIVLSLVGSALFAATAMSQSTADRFTAQVYPVTVHGVDPVGATTIITEAGVLNCEHTVHGELGGPSQTLTLKPTFAKCTLGPFAAAVVTDDCDYLQHVTTKVAVDKYEGHLQIVCPPNKAITITAGPCKFEIKAQGNLKTVDLNNMTASPESLNDLTITDTVKGVAYTVTQDGFGCPFVGTGAKANGEFFSHQPLTLRGFIPGGAQQGFHIG